MAWKRKKFPTISVGKDPVGQGSHNMPYEMLGENPKKKLRKLYHDRELTLREIGDLLGKDPKTIQRWMIRFNIPRRSKYSSKGKIHPNLEPSRSLAYVTGVLFGDGWVGGKGNTIKLETSNEIFARRFYQHLEKIGLNPHFLSNDYFRVEGTSKEFVNWFRELSTEELKEELTEKRIYAFLAGFIDSEGCVDTNGTRLRIGTTSQKLTKLVRVLLDEIGYTFNLYKLKGGSQWKESYFYYSLERQDKEMIPELIGKLEEFDEFPNN